MTLLTVERIVQRPPMEVFDFVARHHFDNHPRWDPDVPEMTQTSPGVSVGTTARGCDDRVGGWRAARR
jgi:Polyketide cyclase / dehydrase and lipid transport